jgi:hypothetical protein
MRKSEKSYFTIFSYHQVLQMRDGLIVLELDGPASVQFGVVLAGKRRVELR